jgi:hypothetical protein
MYVVMNVNPPRLGSLTIVGKLEFDDSEDRLLEANTIAVWGELAVGSAGAPFQHDSDIVLHGERRSPTLIIHDSRFLGNKVLAVLGTLNLHGMPVRSWTRLSMTVEAGGAEITLQDQVDWVAGQTIVISSTEYDASETETRVIASIDTSSMVITVTAPLDHRHYAGEIETAHGTKFLGAAVGMLNRNVRVRGADGAGEDVNYGAHLIVMDDL